MDFFGVFWTFLDYPWTRVFVCNIYNYLYYTCPIFRYVDLIELVLIVGIPSGLAFLLYTVPPRWVRRLVSALVGLDGPEDFGVAIATAGEEFLSGHKTPDGEEISPGELLMMYVQGAVVAGASVLGPYVMEELPILIASKSVNNWNEDMQKKSAVARGVAKLNGKQYQAFQSGLSHAMKGIGTAAASGIVPEMPDFMKKVMGFIRATPEIKAALAEFGVVGAGGAIGGGELPPSQSPSTPGPSTPGSSPPSRSRADWTPSSGHL